MNSVGKLIVTIGFLSVLSAMPLAAQIDGNTVDFATSFPFYAGDTKLPAGQYKVTQPDPNADVLLVESIHGAHSAFVNFVPTQSAQTHRQSDVTFQKYGDTGYLNQVWIEGQNYGIEANSSKVETKAEAAANAVQHSTVASGQ
jgi:hypothetical protein